MSVSMKYFPHSLIEDINLRPNTMNPTDPSKGLKRKSHTSLKLLSRMPQSSLPKDLDKDLLFKLKPKTINIDKEQLFQENLQLKLKNHSLNEDLTKSKTRLSQLELELNKKDKSKETSGQWDKSQSSSLTQNLKQTIKDLKLNLENKEKEIFKLRSNLKCSRTNELEAELQAYIDECTRLRHHLEETLKSKAETSDQDFFAAQALESLQKDKNRLESENKNLQDEVKDLKSVIEEEKRKKKMVVKKQDVNPRAEIQKLKLVLQGKEREIKEKEKEFSDKEREFKEKEEKLRSENGSLKLKLETALSKLKQGPGAFLAFKPSAPVFFTVVNSCVGKLKGLKEFLEGLKPVKSMSQVFDYMKGLYPQVKQSQIIELLDLFRIKKPELIHDLVREWFFLYDYSTSASEPVLDTLIKQQKAENKSKPIIKQEIVSQPVFNKVKNEKNIKVIHEEDEEKEEVLTKDQKSNLNPINDTELSEEQKVQILNIPFKKNNENPAAETPPNEPDPTPSTPNIDYRESSAKTPVLSSAKSEEKRPRTKADSRKSSSSQKLWEKLSMALKIHRLSKNEFLNFLPEQINQKIISQLLTSEPFNLSAQHSKSLTKSFFTQFSPRTQKVTSEQIFEVFQKNTEDWEIFSQEEEDNFNQELTKIVEKFKSEISNYCKEIDKSGSGIVSLEDFQRILRNLGVTMSNSLWNYSKLLFYSCNEELDQVPYTYFLENYGKEEYSEDAVDQEIASKVRTYIEKIAEKLIDEGLTVPEAFLNTKGLIFPQQFVESLRKLGIDDIPEYDMELMMQALQYEDSEEACVLLEEFQEILSNYGVNEGGGTQIRHSTSKDEETLKIGNSDENYENDFEDENEEYSEDSNN